ncbi:MAG: DNA polymerase III subunit delta' [Pseudomonadota bacterium]
MLNVAESHDTLEDIPPPCAATKLFDHKEQVDLLQKSLSSGHHAIILEGEAGIGKATAAFLQAKLLCGAAGDAHTGIDPDSAAHRQITQGAHPNVMHLTRPWSQQTKKWKTAITVDEVRKLQSFFGMTANQNEPRIVIVDTLQDMNRNAANALLKMLEEPPANALFLLISQGLGSVLPTIRSRAQLVRFSPLSNTTVAETLHHISPDGVASQQAEQLALHSSGSVRHALLMGLYGGLELLEALQALLSSPEFDTLSAHRLADISADRKQTAQGEILFDMLVQSLHSHAIHSAKSGDLKRSGALASQAQDVAAEQRRREAFNLDKKQGFLVTAHKVHAAIHAQL